MRKVQALVAALAGIVVVVGVSVVVARQGSPVPDPAVRLVPAEAIAYATVDLTPSLTQGRALLDLLERLPDIADDPAAARDAVLDDVLEPSGLKAADLEGWRGDRLSGFVLPEFAAAAVVVPTRDPAAALAAAERATSSSSDGPVEELEAGGLPYSVRRGSTLAWGVVDGHLVAGAEAAVRAVLDRGPVLGDDADYLSTSAALPPRPLASAYLDGSAFPGPWPAGLLYGGFSATSMFSPSAPMVESGDGAVYEGPGLAPQLCEGQEFAPPPEPPPPAAAPEGAPPEPLTPYSVPCPAVPPPPVPSAPEAAVPPEVGLVPLDGDVVVQEELVPLEPGQNPVLVLPPDQEVGVVNVYPEQATGGLLGGLGSGGSVALALTAGSDALLLDLASRPAPDLPTVGLHGSDALGDLPADALAGVAVADLGALLVGALDAVEQTMGAPVTPDDLGFDVREVLGGLDDAQGFLLAGPDGRLHGGAAAAVTDAAAAQRALDAARSLPGPGTPIEEVERDGLTGFRMRDPDGEAVTSLRGDDRLVFAAGDPALDALLADGERLGDTEAYRRAVAALDGLPPVAYADVARLAAVDPGSPEQLSRQALDAGLGGVAFGARTDDAGLSRQRLAVTLLPR